MPLSSSVSYQMGMIITVPYLRELLQRLNELVHVSA